MSDSFKAGLFATAIATVFGTAAWILGLAHVLWPAHPFFADLLLTLAATIAAKQIWLSQAARR
jgi:hypothetical protein